MKENKKRLKKEFNVDTLNEADNLLNSMLEKIEEDEKKLEGKLNILENKYDFTM